MKLLAFTGVWLGFIGLSIVIDYIIIKIWKTVPYHGISFALRLIIGCMWSFLVYEGSMVYWAIAYCGLSFSVLFNLGLNLVRGMSWDHLGDSMFDSFEKEFGVGHALGLKLVLIVMCVFVLLDLPCVGC